MKLKFASLLLLPTFFIQAEQLWTPHLQTKDNVVASRSAQDTLSAQFQLSSIDELRQQIQEQGGIRIPLPQGDFISIQLIEDQILPANLAEKYPHLKNYQAISVDGLPMGQFSMTGDEFQGLFQYEGRFIQLERVNAESNIYRVSYPQTQKDHELKMSEPKQLPFTENALQLRFGGPVASRSSNERQTFRIAFSATSSFTQALGGKEKTMARITQLVSNINAIYITDLNIRFTLSPAQDQLIFDHPSRDPFPANLTKDQFTTENTRVQSPFHDQLDIGMVLTKLGQLGRSMYTGGGLAYFKTLCSDPDHNNRSKSSAVSETSDPYRGTFYLIIAHELGHQLGANHTYNSCLDAEGRPLNNMFRKQTDSYVEPGSGSTIMAYPGVCGAHNLKDKDKLEIDSPSHHFHSYSIEEMNQFLASDTIKSCGSREITSNHEPVIQDSSIVGDLKIIPANTPFMLSGIAEDLDNDPLTYIWEQADSSQPRTAGKINTDTGEGPLFRTYSPTSENSRTFPLMQHLLNPNDWKETHKAKVKTGDVTFSGVNGETLPTTQREVHFNLTARDGDGGVSTKQISFLVTDTVGPLTVHDFEQHASFDEIESVSWDVAGTDAPDYSCQEVNISLLEVTEEPLKNTHTETRYQVLTEYPLTTKPVDNNGDAFVSLPNQNIPKARIKVSCADNIFFNISNKDFAVSKRLDKPSVSSIETAKTVKQGQRIELTPSQLNIDNLTLNENQSWVINVPDFSFKYSVKQEVQPDVDEEKTIIQLQNNYYGDLSIPVVVDMITDDGSGVVARRTIDTYMLKIKVSPNKKLRTTDLPTTGTTPRDTGTVPTSQNSGGGDSGGASFLFLFTIPLLFRRK
ncbi:reprolysin-like metallopeptidase [Algicola sagamiensis]|uniref:reprolysin-like metallopeptidase n=1 Tax=Algicola sagamiensis TaxID=163869 RepID=UPI000366152B|nr:M12 family metallo-peptidase [Algicola sagamiensis]